MGTTLESTEHALSERPPADAPAPALVVDAIGQFAESLGFARSLGKVWATLYLSADPMHAGELREQLEISAGSVSTRVNELEAWGLLTRERPRYNHPIQVAVDHDPRKFFARLVVERELRVLTDLIGSLESALPQLETDQHGDGSSYAIERVEDLLRLAEMGRRLFSALVESVPPDLRVVDMPPEYPALAVADVGRAPHAHLSGTL